MDEMIGTIRQMFPMFTVMLLWGVLSQLMPSGAQAKTVVSIAISGESHVISGSSHQLTATASCSDGTQGDVTGSVAWSSSDTTIASVSSSGLVAAIAPGTAQITATAGSVAGTFSLTVVAQTPGWTLIDVTWD